LGFRLQAEERKVYRTPPKGGTPNSNLVQNRLRQQAGKSQGNYPVLALPFRLVDIPGKAARLRVDWFSVRVVSWCALLTYQQTPNHEITRTGNHEKTLRAQLTNQVCHDSE
jgi:hypothetical protein